MNIDLKIFYFFNNFAGKSRILDMLIVFFSDYFQYILGIIFVLLLFYSVYTHREKWQIFWVTVISVTVARFGIVSLIRLFYHRPRPYLLYQVHQLTSDGSYSFPSGHAAFFFAMAMAIYFYNKKWSCWFFLAAIIISLSRIVAGVHYPTDILGGAIVGILSAWLVYIAARYFEKNKTA